MISSGEKRLRLTLLPSKQSPQRSDVDLNKTQFPLLVLRLDDNNCHTQGLKFPWESAVSGREVCPEDVYGQQEIHINGDVALAFQQYLYLTQVIQLGNRGFCLSACALVFGDISSFCARTCRCSQRVKAVKWSSEWLITGSPEQRGTPMTSSITSSVKKVVRGCVVFFFYRVYRVLSVSGRLRSIL